MATSSQYAFIQTRAHALSTTEPKTRPVFNTYCFRRPSGLFAPNKTNITTAFVAAIGAAAAAVLNVSYVADWIDVRMLDDPLDPYLTTAYTATGTVTGDSLPSVNSVRMQLKTGIRGRKFKGAKSYGPIAESDTLLDHLTAGGLTAWQGFAAAILAGFTDADGNAWTPQVVSYRLSTFNPTTAIVVAEPVTQILVNPILGIMRRRRQPT